MIHKTSHRKLQAELHEPSKYYKLSYMNPSKNYKLSYMNPLKTTS
jgi:hypothetical protein